jgi:hypothetical protein
VAKAVDKSLDILGPSSKNALLFHLMHTYSISLDEGNCSQLEEIQDALKQVLGKGAALVISWINNELKEELK